MYKCIKVDSDFNDFFPTKALSKYENDVLFITLLAFHKKLNEKIDKEDPDQHYKVVLTYQQLIEFLDLPGDMKRPARIYEFMVGMYQKLKDFNCYEEQSGTEKNRKYIQRYLFTTMEADETREEYTVFINPQLAYIVRDPKFFTMLDVVYICSLKNKYAQILYRKLQQWGKAGQYSIKNIALMRKVFGIPDSYGDYQITNRVIAPAVKEIKKRLEKYKDLDVEVIKQGKNHRLVGFQFSWKSENVLDEQNQIDEEETEFIPPTKEEVKAYFQENKYESEPQLFFLYYTEQNWKHANGKQISNWKRQADQWEIREKTFLKTNKPSKQRIISPTQFNDFSQREYDFATLEEKLRK